MACFWYNKVTQASSSSIWMSVFLPLLTGFRWVDHSVGNFAPQPAQATYHFIHVSEGIVSLDSSRESVSGTKKEILLTICAVWLLVGNSCKLQLGEGEYDELICKKIA